MQLGGKGLWQHHTVAVEGATNEVFLIVSRQAVFFYCYSVTSAQRWNELTI